MSFHGQRLRQLRLAAGLGRPLRRRNAVQYLVPQDDSVMPSFYVPGMREPKQPESEFIDCRYFSPAALRWADAVVEYRATGGKLDRDDEECFARVWAAMRAGRRPTAAQQREFEKDRKWQRATARIPELYAKEVHRHGVKNYGPNDPLPDDIKEPGSARELIYRYLFKELGYKTADSASTAHNEWLKARGIRDGTQ